MIQEKVLLFDYIYNFLDGYEDVEYIEANKRFERARKKFAKPHESL